MPEALQSVAGLAHMFLGIESDAFPMDGAAIIVLDAASAEGDFGFDAVRHTLACRIPSTILGRRLVRFPPWGLSYATAYWAVDQRFDIDRHLSRATVSPPGDLTALAQLTLDLSEGALPRDRPLWKAWFVDGLAEGGCALIIRLHHAAVDGMAGMDLFAELFDREPTAANPLELPRPLRAPTRGAVLTRSVPEVLTAPIRAGRRVAALTGALSAGRKAAAGVTRGRVFRDSAPDCLFNRPVQSSARSLALLELPMTELKSVKNHHGITVTDLVLSLVAGGVRTYLQSRGEPVDRPLAAMCPMSVRSAHPGGTNQFVMMVNRLPVDLASGDARMQAIHHETSVNKRVAQAEAEVADSAGTLANLLPPALWSAMGVMPDAVAKRLPALANLEVSSIPGPPFPLYLAGAEVKTLHARTFVQRGSGLFISFMSYNETMFVGITAIRELVPDPEMLTAAIRDELTSAAPRSAAAL